MYGYQGLAPGPLLPRPLSPRRRAWFRFGIGVGLVILALTAVWGFRGPILASYARWFRVDNAAPSDAIVMLLGGPDSRPGKAAELLQEGLADKIYFCSGSPVQMGLMSEANDAARQMVRKGVSPRAIAIIQSPVASTRDEALAVLQVAKSLAWKRITIVTTSFHTRRALWIFQKVFDGSGVEVRVAAADDPFFNEQNWWHRDESAIIYFIETIKTVFYWIRY